jgi:hypothetical protein
MYESIFWESGIDQITCQMTETEKETKPIIPTV